jgi:hypothetical protein
MKRSLFDAGLALCTVGSALFAVGASKDPLSKVITLPNYSFSALMILGGILAAVGGIAFLSSFVVEPLESGVTRVVYGDIDSRYLCVPANPSDLPGLHALYTQYFGADVPSVDLMRAWLRRCGTAFTLVQRVTQDYGLGTRQVLVGSFKLLPLTAEGVRAMKSGQASGSSFRPEHISGIHRRPAAWYVGDVVATTRFSRGVVMAHINAACSFAVKKAVSIYARPLTRDGRRIITKHGFVQVSDGKSTPEIGRMCRLDALSTQVATRRRTAHKLRLTPLADA